MKELKVGMYIRYIPTQGNYTQKISKITKTKNCMLDMAYYLDNSEEPVFSSHFDDIVGVSEYIIDLIEVGDYVNGELVIAKDSDNRLYVPEDLGQPYDREFSNGCFEYTLLDKNFEIKSIVTKEQFNSVKYEVE